MSASTPKRRQKQPPIVVHLSDAQMRAILDGMAILQGAFIVALGGAAHGEQTAGTMLSLIDSQGKPRRSKRRATLKVLRDA